MVEHSSRILVRINHHLYMNSVSLRVRNIFWAIYWRFCWSEMYCYLPLLLFIIQGFAFILVLWTCVGHQTWFKCSFLCLRSSQLGLCSEVHFLVSLQVLTHLHTTIWLTCSCAVHFFSRILLILSEWQLSAVYLFIISFELHFTDSKHLCLLLKCKNYAVCVSDSFI